MLFSFSRFSAFAGLFFLATLPVAATTWNLKAGDNLQAAVNKSVGGDVIVLPTNYVWYGNLVLPNRSENGWVVIQSAAVSQLPANIRVSPSQASLMPKLISPTSDPVIQNDYASPIHSNRPAHHYEFIGIEITTTWSLNWNLVLFDPGDNPTVADIPSYIEFMRCYIHANPKGGEQIRGIMASVRNFIAQDNYMSGFAATFVEANAISMISSPGPYRILNNYLEAAGECVMFAGVPSPIPGLIPSDIVVRHNYFTKQLAWRGSPYIVKNLLEFKNGKNITIDQNVFEYNWTAAQSGAAILLVPRTGGDVQPLNTIQQVTFTNNIVRHVAKVLAISAFDDASALPASKVVWGTNMVFRNNFFDDVSGANGATEVKDFRLRGLLLLW